MRKFLFHAAFVVVVLMCLFTVWLLVAQAQVPTGPVVVMYTPSSQAVQMFADGSIILPPLSTVSERTPPQDSNDVAVRFNKFGTAVCGVPAPPAACATFKITVGK